MGGPWEQAFPSTLGCTGSAISRAILLVWLNGTVSIQLNVKLTTAVMTKLLKMSLLSANRDSIHG